MDHPKVVIGLDVGAETFAATALRSAGEEGEIKGSLTNRPEGFDELTAWMKEQGVTKENGWCVWRRRESMGKLYVIT